MRIRPVSRDRLAGRRCREGLAKICVPEWAPDFVPRRRAAAAGLPIVDPGASSEPGRGKETSNRDRGILFYSPESPRSKRGAPPIATAVLKPPPRRQISVAPGKRGALLSVAPPFARQTPQPQGLEPGVYSVQPGVRFRPDVAEESA